MGKVRPGLEALIEENLDLVEGKRVGVVTNHSAVTSDCTHIVDALLKAGVNITALYGPEHGVWGHVADGQEIDSSKDPRTGIQVFSLYGATRKPTPEMLEPIDVLIYDLQDVGARFYTFTYTMSYCMQACAENGKKFIVLDRPNPINGVKVEGRILDPRFASFVGLHPIPFRHGMTIGELARMFNEEYGFKADLEVVPCKGWERCMWFDDTGLPFVWPSPNIPTWESALAFVATCLIEGTELSEGRGTTKPFEMVGAPWVDAFKMADRLNSLELAGVRFRATYFIPLTSKHQGKPCAGVQIHIMDRDQVNAVEVGLHVVKSLQDLHPGDFKYRERTDGVNHFDRLAGSDDVQNSLVAGVAIKEIMDSWADELAKFLETRWSYLQYR